MRSCETCQAECTNAGTALKISDVCHDYMPPPIDKTPVGDNECVDRPEDTQVGGDHYVRLTVQPWDAIQAWIGVSGFVAYLRGNIIKYLCRCDKKHETCIEDLKKARHYLDKLISVLEST